MYACVSRDVALCPFLSGRLKVSLSAGFHFYGCFCCQNDVIIFVFGSTLSQDDYISVKLCPVFF